MKVKDLLSVNGSEVISESHQEEFVLLVENIAAEMKSITADVIDKPYARFKSAQIGDLSRKLRNWAVDALMNLKNNKKAKNAKKMEIVLGKIIDNPAGAANQIFTTVVARKAVEDKKKESRKAKSGPSTEVKFDYWFGKNVTHIRY